MRRWLAAAAAASSLGCGPFYCVARGTRVATPGGPRRVEGLRVGDEVFAVDPASGALAAAKLTAVRSARREVGSLQVAGRVLEVTSDHPLYDPDGAGFFPAGDWFLGRRERALWFDGERCRAVSVERALAFAGLAEVFDLTVDHPWHTFVAEGVVVHNKSPPLCQIDQPDAGWQSLRGGESGGTCGCQSSDGGMAPTGQWHCPAGGGTAACVCGSTDGGP